MIGEQMDILNNDLFNQKLESLNRRVEQVQCRKTHEEIAKTFLKKVSKLERRINAVIAFQEEVFSKVAVHQTTLPRADYQNPVQNQLGPSAFSPDTINTPTSPSNTLLLSPYTGFNSAQVSEYISSDEVILVSIENQNSATANNSAIPNNQISTQAEMSATVQSEMKERKLKVIDLTEENHNCSKAHGGPHQSRYPHCSLRKTPPWSWWMCPEGSCTPWRAHTWSRLLAGAVAHGEQATQKQVFWQDLWPVGEPRWSNLLLMDCTWRGPMLEQFVKEYILWERPHAGEREQHEEEGAAEMKCYGLTRTPSRHPPVPLGRGRR
ncbi:activating transcription factor 7-interacting protein 2 isoform 2-T3 [Theristicus caerulescens]